MSCAIAVYVSCVKNKPYFYIHQVIIYRCIEKNICQLRRYTNPVFCHNKMYLHIFLALAYHHVKKVIINCKRLILPDTLSTYLLTFTNILPKRVQ